MDAFPWLSVQTVYIRLHEIEVEVFVMKKYGDQASWTSLFVIPNVGMCLSHCRIWVPLCFAKNAEVLVHLETPLVRRIYVYGREFNFCHQILIEPKNCSYDIKALNPNARTLFFLSQYECVQPICFCY